MLALAHKVAVAQLEALCEALRAALSEIEALGTEEKVGEPEAVMGVAEEVMEGAGDFEGVPVPREVVEGLGDVLRETVLEEEWLGEVAMLEERVARAMVREMVGEVVEDLEGACAVGVKVRVVIGVALGEAGGDAVPVDSRRGLLLGSRDVMGEGLGRGVLLRVTSVDSEAVAALVLAAVAVAFPLLEGRAGEAETLEEALWLREMALEVV